ncbi:hypothetical protein Ahy_A09g043667 [Arachis hypogaea]|uniref:PB1-like domain-containing protein n=1 Tax=Arachis hypogaea TaxID=3818 RepID=A0A445BIT5_ARAHY|nr:hypothetical protein Ahy_A09g043667 [Arachis hypogaea]
MVKMDVLLDIMFHHGGNLRYTPDNLTCLGDLDEDILVVFFIRNYYKELGYDKILYCWWLVPGRTLETRLRNLNSDDKLRDRRCVSLLTRIMDWWMCILSMGCDLHIIYKIRRKR